jgi:hypothetical protein
MPSLSPVTKIISGGQTGADRAGLDAGRALGIEIGGYCPRGRRAEDGAIPAVYPVTELASPEYPPRTRANVDAADATVVFTVGAPDRGSALTIEIARTLAKPVLAIDLSVTSVADAATALARWIRERKPRVLNVAGSRESRAPGIYALVRDVLSRAISSTARTSA